MGCLVTRDDTPPEPFDLLASLVLEDGRLWGDAAAEFQRDDARAIFEGAVLWHFLTRPRGGSKSTDLAAVLLVWLVCLARPGEKGHIAAADKDQSRFAVLDALTGLVNRTSSLRRFVTIQADKVIATRTGATVEVLAADGASALGLRSSFVVVDEVAAWGATRNHRRMWAALVSALGKIPGCRFVVLTSAGEPAHWSYKVLKEARRSRHWRVHEVPGPLEWIDPEQLEAQRPLLLESEFAQFHLNLWVENEDRLVSEADLEAAAVLDGPLAPVPDRGYLVACDLGLVNDPTVAVVAHAESDETRRGDPRLIVIDRIARWQGSKRRPVSITEEVEPWILSASREFNRARVVIDSWNAAGTVERLKAMQLTAEEIKLTEPIVGRIGTSLHLALREHRVHLPKNEVLLDELRSVRLRRTSLGEYRLDHDSSKHDDQAMAIGLAVIELAGPPRSGGPIIWSDKEWAEHKALEVATLGDGTLALQGFPSRVTVARPGFAMPDSVLRSDADFEDDKTNGVRAGRPSNLRRTQRPSDRRSRELPLRPRWPADPARGRRLHRAAAREGSRRIPA
jgi:hypothetical protein